MNAQKGEAFAVVQTQDDSGLLFYGDPSYTFPLKTPKTGTLTPLNPSEMHPSFQPPYLLTMLDTHREHNHSVKQPVTKNRELPAVSHIPAKGHHASHLVDSQSINEQAHVSDRVNNIDENTITLEPSYYSSSKITEKTTLNATVSQKNTNPEQRPETYPLIPRISIQLCNAADTERHNASTTPDSSPTPSESHLNVSENFLLLKRRNTKNLVSATPHLIPFRDRKPNTLRQSHKRNRCSWCDSFFWRRPSATEHYSGFFISLSLILKRLFQ